LKLLINSEFYKRLGISWPNLHRFFLCIMWWIETSSRTNRIYCDRL